MPNNDACGVPPSTSASTSSGLYGPVPLRYALIARRRKTLAQARGDPAKHQGGDRVYGATAADPTPGLRRARAWRRAVETTHEAELARYAIRAASSSTARRIS